ncbi:MAG: porin family protein [Bacteroidota bacterium]
MKRFIPTLLFLLFLCDALFSQISGGIKAGFNMANQSIEDDRPVPLSPNNRHSFHVGIFANVPLGGMFSLQPEVLYSQQGSEYRIFSEVTDKIDYINVPLLIRFQPITLISIHAGPHIGFLTSAQSTSEDVSFDVKDIIKKRDFGANFGAQADFKFGLIMGVRYTVGLTDINDNELSDLDIKNRNFQIYLGFKLPCN